MTTEKVKEKNVVKSILSSMIIGESSQWAVKETFNIRQGVYSYQTISGKRFRTEKTKEHIIVKRVS